MFHGLDGYNIRLLRIVTEGSAVRFCMEPLLFALSVSCRLGFDVIYFLDIALYPVCPIFKGVHTSVSFVHFVSFLFRNMVTPSLYIWVRQSIIPLETSSIRF